MRPPPRFVLLDGGVGHILKSADPKGHLNFLGGALAPASAIREAHRSFVEAGAEILTTATFGVTANSLRRAGLLESEELESITRRVARLAVEVAAEENKKRKQQEEEEGGRGRGRRRRRVLVAGCLPPLGENCYLPSCPPDEESAEVAAAAAKVYARIAAALLEAGVDLFLVETCSGGADAEAAVRGASAAVSAAAAAAAASSSSPPSPPPPLWLSFTVDDEDPSRLRGGEGLEAAARRALLEPATGGCGGAGGAGGGGGREEEAEYRIPISALLLNCSSPRAVSAALPLLHRAVSERRRKEKGTREEEVGIGGYANGFRLSTTSWLRSRGTPPPPPAAVVPAPASDAAAREGTQEDDDYDDEGMIRPEAYARHAAGWLRSCCCHRRGSGGEGQDGGDGSRSGQEESCCLFPSSSPSFFVLGGCCGVGPDHVRVLRSLLDSEEEEEVEEEEEEEEAPPL